jgi:hypothetical protein
MQHIKRSTNNKFKTANGGCVEARHAPVVLTAAKAVCREKKCLSLQDILSSVSASHPSVDTSSYKQLTPLRLAGAVSTQFVGSCDKVAGNHSTENEAPLSPNRMRELSTVPDPAFVRKRTREQGGFSLEETRQSLPLNCVVRNPENFHKSSDIDNHGVRFKYDGDGDKWRWKCRYCLQELVVGHGTPNAHLKNVHRGVFEDRRWVGLSGGDLLKTHESATKKLKAEQENPESAMCMTCLPPQTPKSRVVRTLEAKDRAHRWDAKLVKLLAKPALHAPIDVKVQNNKVPHQGRAPSAPSALRLLLESTRPNRLPVVDRGKLGIFGLGSVVPFPAVPGQLASVADKS